MKSAILGFAAAAAVVSAQNVTLIPSGISSGCTAALEAVNSDSSLSSCIEPLLNATAKFSPLASTTPTTSDINYALADICRSSAGCSDSAVRGFISSISTACSAELTGSSPSSSVRELYDLLYILNPLKDALCSIDSANQEYCVTQLSSASSSSSSSNSTSNSTSSSLYSTLASSVQYAGEHLYVVVSSATGLARRVLDTRQSSSSQETLIAPNVTTYKDTNLPFLFLQPTYTSSQLCTPCTREIMVAYISWETSVPYAFGLASSPTLGGQIDLWTAINSTCGTTFVNAINSQVSQSTTSSTSAAGVSAGVSAGVIAFTAVVAGAFALVA